MGGGGGNRTFHSGRPRDIASQVRNAEKASLDKEFDSQLSQVLSDLLSKYNDRDADGVRSKIELILKYLSGDVEGELRTLFGGSVAKHTYVDGISDVDALLILNDSELGKLKPAATLSRITRTLAGKLGDKAIVEEGSVAVTVKFKDGTELQFIPAVKTDDGLKVPAWRQNKWSNINPQAFSAALTRHNDKHGKALIPLIKLAKAINSALPETQRLSGYHLESLAIEAFRGYDGPRTTVHMLPHFFARASELVTSPLKDKTGQSLHVDEYLGEGGSPERQQAAHVLDRIARRMQNASANKDINFWKTLF